MKEQSQLERTWRQSGTCLTEHRRCQAGFTASLEDMITSLGRFIRERFSIGEPTAGSSGTGTYLKDRTVDIRPGLFPPRALKTWLLV